MGSNRKAIDATLRSLGDRVGGDHHALIQACKSLADAVDAAPDNASLWREYRGALEDLAALTKTEDDAVADLVSRLRSPMGDTAHQPTNARAATRTNSN